jgi:5-methylcytosine-specific restriction endonuclease McrA
MTEKHKTIHIDESDRGSCYYCGSPAAIKVGMWSDLSHTNEEDEKQSWRAVLICKECNSKHSWVDEQGLPDTYLGY